MLRLTRLSALLCAAVALAALPAPARGSGAIVPADGQAGGAQRIDEWSVVRFDGARETIEMKLRARMALERAALIMPVPSRASFSLGDDRVFEEIDRRTKPRREQRTEYVFFGDEGDEAEDGTTGAPASGAGGGGVQVFDTRDLGPLRVVTLRGKRAAAVTRFLEDNGFATPDGIAPIAQDYLDRGWLLVAVRLRGKAGESVRSFQPLRIRFATREPVYPLRFSKLAPNGSSARVDLITPWPAGVRDWVDMPDEEGARPLPNGRFFAGPLPGGRYLTSLRFFVNAESPDRDPRFVRVERDDHRRVIVEEQTVALVPFIVIAIIGGLLFGALIGFVRSRRERRAAP